MYALGNTCGLRIFCIHFILRSFGLIKLLLFDNRDISTSFIFRFLIMDTYVFGIAALI